MSEREQQIGELLDRAVDDLYAQVGAETPEMRALSPTREELIAAGRRWLRKMHEVPSALCSVICLNRKIRALTRPDLGTSERAMLAAAVLDALLEGRILPHGPAPMTVAVLLVRVGIHDLCKQLWATAIPMSMASSPQQSRNEGRSETDTGEAAMDGRRE